MMLALDSKDIDQTAPIGPQIREALRQRIIRCDLTPATRISESEIAGTYQTSRQPVRETFIKLAEEGLVEVRPQRGTYVTRISQQAVMDARFVREAVEADIVKELARSRDDALIPLLDEQLEEQRASLGQSPDRFISLDEAFHKSLARASGKETVWRLVEGMKAQMDRVRYLALVQPFPMADLLAQHEVVVRAITDRKVRDAEAAMRSHLRQILDDLPLIAAERPEYFEAPLQQNDKRPTA